jgi:predicted alpha/beta-hydrolase family hydrolase
MRDRGGVGWAGLGDAAQDLKSIVSTSSLTGEDAVRFLQRQVNRYTLDGGAPVHLRIGAAPVAVTGALDDNTVTRAVWIMQMRAGMAHIQWNDNASAELLRDAMAAWTNPRQFVVNNMNKVIDTLKLFGDKNGIPGAKSLAGLTPTMIAAGLTAAALVVVFATGRKR